jgi:hypothetical protein
MTGMQQCYVVDAANAPWKRSSTEGVTFACQVLLSGEDGGPEALHFRFDDCPSVYAHMHLTSQFQLLLNGAMDFPRGVKHLGLANRHTSLADAHSHQRVAVRSLGRSYPIGCAALRREARGFTNPQHRQVAPVHRRQPDFGTDDTERNSKCHQPPARRHHGSRMAAFRRAQLSYLPALSSFAVNTPQH